MDVLFVVGGYGGAGLNGDRRQDLHARDYGSARYAGKRPSGGSVNGSGRRQCSTACTCVFYVFVIDVQYKKVAERRMSIKR